LEAAALALVAVYEVALVAAGVGPRRNDEAGRLVPALAAALRAGIPHFLDAVAVGAAQLALALAGRAHRGGLDRLRQRGEVLLQDRRPCGDRVERGDRPVEALLLRLRQARQRVGPDVAHGGRVGFAVLF